MTWFGILLGIVLTPSGTHTDDEQDQWDYLGLPPL